MTSNHRWASSILRRKRKLRATFFISVVRTLILIIIIRIKQPFLLASSVVRSRLPMIAFHFANATVVGNRTQLCKQEWVTHGNRARVGVLTNEQQRFFILILIIQIRNDKQLFLLASGQSCKRGQRVFYSTFVQSKSRRCSILLFTRLPRKSAVFTLGNPRWPSKQEWVTHGNRATECSILEDRVADPRCSILLF
jgi:hypothetical protein